MASVHKRKTAEIGDERKLKCSVFATLITWNRLLMNLWNRHEKLKTFTDAPIQH
jgi:hypothetical protein